MKIHPEVLEISRWRGKNSIFRPSSLTFDLWRWADLAQNLIDLMHWRHKGSHLHNNDASLVSRSAHVLCWQCALALSLSVRGPGRASPAVWLAGFATLAACLAMTHVAVFRLTPNAAGRPSVTSYAYGLLVHLLPVVHPCTKFDENPPRGSWDFALTRWK